MLARDEKTVGDHQVTDASARPAYSPPELQIVGLATTLVKGGGGMSGNDRNAYYYFSPDE